MSSVSSSDPSRHARTTSSSSAPEKQTPAPSSSLQAPGALSAFFAKKALGDAFTPKEMKELRQVAAQRVAQYDAVWSGAALADKLQQFTRAPTAAMTTVANRILRNDLVSSVGADFDVSTVSDPKLAAALRSFAFLRLAEGRADISEAGSDPKQDWDGSALSGYTLPARAAMDDQKALARKALTSLDEHLGHIDVTKLPANEQALIPQLQDFLTGLSLGSALSFGTGSDTATALTGMINTDWDFVTTADTKQAATEPFLRDLVTEYLSPDLNQVNAGTINSVLNYVLPDFGSEDAVKSEFGDPATNAGAKNVLLASQLLQQSLASDPRKDAQGYDAKADAPQHLFQAWMADTQQPKSQWLTQTQVRAGVDGFFVQRATADKDAALTAVQTLFPQLSAAELAKVKDAISAQSSFGTLKQAVLDALPAAQSKEMLEKLTGDKAGDLGTIGGAGRDPAQQRQQFLDTVWTPTKEFLQDWAKTNLPKAGVDWTAYFEKAFDPTAFTLNFAADSSSTGPDGKTAYGCANPRTTDQMVREVLHEFTHHLQVTTGQEPHILGTAIEGGAFQDELNLAPQAIDFIRKSDPGLAALGKFSLVNSDVRFAARTDGVLASMSRPDANRYIREVIAPRWGITDPALIEALVQRSFFGTQYLQYLGGTILEGKTLDSIKQLAKLPADFELTPMMLEVLGIDTSQPTQATADALRAKLGLPALS